jgi:hypothetical protein
VAARPSVETLPQCMYFNLLGWLMRRRRVILRQPLRHFWR